MSADLSIHVFEGITEEDLRMFFSSSLGSKYFDFKQTNHEEWLDSCDKIASTPGIWVGEVSWLKAALFEDADTFIPNTVAEVTEIIGEDLPIIDDSLIEKIGNAFQEVNNTVKIGGVWDGKGYRIADWNDIKAFLEQHRGKRVFTVSW